MQNISDSADLINAIQLLEVERTNNEQLLKKQILLAREGIEPVNILKNTFRSMASSPDLIDDIIVPAISLGAGYISKKVIAGESDKAYRKLFGTIIQFGVARIISQNPDAIKSVGKYVFQLIFPPIKDTKSES